MNFSPPPPLNKLSKKVQWKLFLLKKEILQSFSPTEDTLKKVLLITGCQRSGTTMMTKIFERDLNAKVYGEFSKLSVWDPGKLRLNPLNQVKREVEKDPSPLIVMKPLVESQNLPELLNYFPNSKALWMYRHYKDVAASNLKNFGNRNGINDLRPIVKQDPLNWRSEGVTDEVREVVKRFFSEDMGELDAAALFWYVRNSIFFDLKLENEPRVKMCWYDELVKNPDSTMEEIYDFIDIPFPGDKITKDVKTSSIGKGKNIDLHPEIDTLCEEMLQRLKEAHHKKMELVS